MLLNPEAPHWSVEPPPTYDVLLETSQGDVRLTVNTEWAPLGAQRFYNLVRAGFYDGARFFRVLPGFAVQFGASGHPAVDSLWSQQSLPDEAPRVINDGGTLAFAMAGPNTRSTQLFFNYRHNEMLDAQGFAPIGRVVDGAPILYRLYGEYGETAPLGTGPDFGCILENGNGYLAERFPRLDSIARARVLE